MPTKFQDKVYNLCKKVPKGILATDIIVGFPGETDEQFLDSIALIKEIIQFKNSDMDSWGQY